jgi:hypothetical protein
LAKPTESPFSLRFSGEKAGFLFPAFSIVSENLVFGREIGESGGVFRHRPFSKGFSMPRFRLFTSGAFCAALLLSACTTVSDPVAGTWIEPIPGMPGKVQGFRLEPDGNASSVNMATLTTERWKREGDRLVLEGKSLGNGQTIEYRDEWTVLEAGDVLRLRRADGAERVLRREQ